jgi:hypothetical protein
MVFGESGAIVASYDIVRIVARERLEKLVPNTD